MERKFIRGYIENDDWEKGKYIIRIARVTQSNDFGEWEDIDEDELRCFSGYPTIYEAKQDLRMYKCKEVVCDFDS